MQDRNCPGKKVRKKREWISLITVGEARGKMVLEAPREKMKNLLLHRVM
jgi:hypothetical protein